MVQFYLQHLIVKNWLGEDHNMDKKKEHIYANYTHPI